MKHHNIRFGLFSVRDDYDKVLDFQFFHNIGCSFQFFEGEDHIPQMRRAVRKKKIDILILTRFDHKQREWASEMDQMVKDIEEFIPVLIIDTLFPSVASLSGYGDNVFLLKDASIGGVEPNVIELPLLGVVNFDNLHFSTFSGNPYYKQFVMNQYDEFKNRNYDIMCKLGKPKPVKLLITLLAIKNGFNNPYINISFSRENNIQEYDDVVNVLNRGLLNKFINEFGLGKEAEELMVGSYLSSVYSKSKLNFSNYRLKDYNVDFNSYSEIYTETLSCELNTIQKYPNVIAYTEKTFNNFFDYKIPLPVDTKCNIEYLQQIGFRFPIQPCYIESDDTYESLYHKINEWMVGLKGYDFKTMWEKDFYNVHPSHSYLHHNHKLIFELMGTSFVKDNILYWRSKPMYQATYKILEKLFPNILSDYQGWDYQTYLFFKDKNLL